MTTAHQEPLSRTDARTTVRRQAEQSIMLRFGATVVNVLAATQAPEVIDPVPVAPAGAGTRALLTVDFASAAHVDRVAEALGVAGSGCSRARSTGRQLADSPAHRPTTP